MQLRIKNNNDAPLLVILEPWATEHVVAPQDFIQLKPYGNIPNGAFFTFEHHSTFITVTPEWNGALVHFYSSTGKLID